MANKFISTEVEMTVGKVVSNGSSFDVYIGATRVMTIDSSGNVHFKGDVTGNSTTV